jgi:hypothetical protein
MVHPKAQGDEFPASGETKTTNTSVGDISSNDDLNTVYYAKTQILNDAVQEIGMGKYQVGRLSIWFTSLTIQLVAVVLRDWVWLASVGVTAI